MLQLQVQLLSIAVDIAGDKEETKKLLEEAQIPVPRGRIIRNEEELQEAIDRIGYPFVIKPIDGNHGKGATTNIITWEQALKALEAARRYSRNVICEKFITGFDFRVLVINYKFMCAALRTPASVTGDGEHTIQWLVDETNKDPRRGFGHEKVLTSNQALMTLRKRCLKTKAILWKQFRQKVNWFC